MTDEWGIAARQLALDAVTVEVVDAFAADGIRVILLKGAAIANRLYEYLEQREYGDIDLLLETGAVQRAHRVLENLGFVNLFVGARAGEGIRHATVWRRGSPRPAHVDLHTALPLCLDDPAAVWEELARDTCELRFGGERRVEILSAPAQAFVIACHAVQHGGAGKPRTDLERALERFGSDTWEQAGAIAVRLHAQAAFAAGLRLTRRGRKLLPAMGLDGVDTTTEIRLRMAGVKPGSLALVRLGEAGSPRERLAMLAQVAFPSPPYISFWCQVEVGRPLPLPLAYLYRLLIGARRLPAAVAAWRRARRA